jgi:hypothetical protein
MKYKQTINWLNAEMYVFGCKHHILQIREALNTYLKLNLKGEEARKCEKQLYPQELELEYPNGGEF